MRKGFKLTKVGMIPEDWSQKSIGAISTVIRGASPRPKGDKRYYGGTIPRLMVEDVSRDGKYVTPTVDFLTEEGAKRSRPCKAGTLTIVCSGTVGVPSFLKVDACIHDGFLGIINIAKDVSDEYLYYQFVRMREQFDKSATHGGIFTNLTTSAIKEFLLPVPIKKAEQTAIATALSDMDALIIQTEKLIEKKKAIKQGMMQQLLSPYDAVGKLKEGWVENVLENVASIKARIGWQGLTTAEYKKSGDYLLVTGTEFKNGKIDWDSCFYVDKHRYNQDKNIQVQENDVLVTKDGTIGKVAFASEFSMPATLNSGVFVIRPINNSFYPAFFYYILLSETFKLFLAQLSAGSTINHLYQKDFATFKFFSPISLKQQMSISTCLNVIESEIQILNTKLVKQLQIKQSMMQSLLTGKIRIYKPEHEPATPI